MPIIIDSIDQGTEEWMLCRAGNPGASSISKIITNSGELSKSRQDYLYQLAGEQITGRCEEGFQSPAMKNGHEREDSARSLFEMVHDIEVKKVAIIYKDQLRSFHCSPDGLVGDDAGVEIKCPMLKTHVKYLIDGKLPSDYFGQVQMSLYVSERPKWHFMSFYAGLPPLMLEVQRDEAYISRLAKALDDFTADLMRTVQKLKAIK